MKRLAQRFALDSDSFSRDGVRKKKRFFFTCFDFALKERDYPARFSSPTTKLFWLLSLSERIIKLSISPPRFPSIALIAWCPDIFTMMEICCP